MRLVDLHRHADEPQPRPALQQSIEAAVAFANTGVRCEIIVLRVDPIGTSPSLLMNSGILDRLGLPERVHVRYLGCAGFEAQPYQGWLEATGGDEAA